MRRHSHAPDPARRFAHAVLPALSLAALSACRTTSATTQPDSAAASQIVTWPHLSVDVTHRVIDIDGVVGVNIGFLEQIACLPWTRTHESIVIVFAEPAHIHAGLLLLGLEPGHPGKWLPTDDPANPIGYTFDPPVGPAIDVSVVYEKKGRRVEVPVRKWVRDYTTHKQLPKGPWLFAGSLMRVNYTGREVYVANVSGSVVGLVTFGDEVIAWPEVWPDQEDVKQPVWEADTEAMPEPDTPVTLRLRAVGGRDHNE